MCNANRTKHLSTKKLLTSLFLLRNKWKFVSFSHSYTHMHIYLIVRNVSRTGIHVKVCVECDKGERDLIGSDKIPGKCLLEFLCFSWGAWARMLSPDKEATFAPQGNPLTLTNAIINKHWLDWAGIHPFLCVSFLYSFIVVFFALNICLITCYCQRHIYKTCAYGIFLFS